MHETFEMSRQLGGAVRRSLGTADEEIQEIIQTHRAEDHALLAAIIPPSAAARAVDGAGEKEVGRRSGTGSDRA